MVDTLGDNTRKSNVRTYIGNALGQYIVYLLDKKKNIELGTRVWGL